MYLGIALIGYWCYISVVYKFESGRLVEILALFYVIGRVLRRDHKGLDSLCRWVAVFCLISFILFLGTLLSNEILSFQTRLYAGQAVKNEEFSPYVIYSYQSGLNAHLFGFGYQVALGTVLFCGLTLISRGRKKFVWVFAACIGFLALFFAGERSPVLGVAGGIWVLFLFFGRRRRSIAILAIFAVLSAYWGLSKFEYLREPHTLRRLQSLPDLGTRLSVQKVALGLILKNPTGVQEGDYYSTLIKHNLLVGYVPHNGYLTRVVFGGWPVAIFAILIFGGIFRLVRKVSSFSSQQRPPMQVIVLASLVSVSVNALFHNASFLTFTPECLVPLFLFAAWSDLPSRYVGQSATAIALAK